MLTNWFQKDNASYLKQPDAEFCLFLAMKTQIILIQFVNTKCQEVQGVQKITGIKKLTSGKSLEEYQTKGSDKFGNRK